jgi:5-methylcytosine-specific restriction endonuclease McrA
MVCSSRFTTRQAFRIFCSRQCKSKADYQRWREDPAKVRERVHAWYRLNTERAKQRAKFWNHAHREEKYRTRDARRSILRCTGPLRPSAWSEVLKSYERRCAYCGAAGPLTIDHRIPLSRGGTNTQDNVKPACKSCNSKKATRSEDDFLEALANETIDALSGSVAPLNRV